jgi:hypothetical protein
MYASQIEEIKRPTARSPHPPFPKGIENKTETRNAEAKAEEGEEKRSDLPEKHWCTLCIISIRSSDGVEQQ